MKFLLFIVLLGIEIFAQSSTDVKLARVKYSGGGDWYNDPSSEPNLLKFVAENTNIKVSAKYEFVDLASDDIFKYPMLFLTGHGNLNFSADESRRLKLYLENGGFLYIDDDYGLDKYIRKEIKKVLPTSDFVQIPNNHSIFSSHFVFPKGVPKIHEHDDKTPETLGIFIDGRLAILYTFESNPTDGWADPEVHGNTPEKRNEALKFGTNIIVWALTN